jgi:UDP-N-acetylglucosamine--N-acetylmuramyl-(pentapeptide) pyrophosphoryl-undecaprenol N-acetylglucosamine transferase
LKGDIRVILAGGGTGGHVFPAINIAQYLKKYWGAQCRFIGTRRGIENIKVSQAGFVVKHIWISGFKRSWNLSNLLFPLKLVISLIQSHRELRQFKPNLVIGTGGYVSGPVLYRAIKMKIPTAIQEQNSYPGITTRILASRVDRVFLAYADSLNYLKNVKKYTLVGNPTKNRERSENKEEALRYFGLKKDMPIVLIFGGSQGARNINQALDKILKGATFQNIQLIWQTGEIHFEQYKQKYMNSKNNCLHILPFIDRMDLAYTIADFAICRAGAMTISELAAAALPAILIPLPHAAEDHQLKNAQTIARGGGAYVIEDKPGMEELLISAINDLLTSPEKIRAMAQKIASFHRPNTVQQIAAELEQLLQEKALADV